MCQLDSNTKFNLTMSRNASYLSPFLHLQKGMAHQLTSFFPLLVASNSRLISPITSVTTTILCSDLLNWLQSGCARAAGMVWGRGEQGS